MDLDLNETQQLLQSTARDFLSKEFPHSRLREIEASPDGHSPQLWKLMAEMGWMGLPFPSRYGGADGDLIDLAVLLGEMARAAAVTPYLATMLAGLAVLRHGTEEQRRDVLPRICSGDLIATTAIAEPEGRYDVETVRMAAKADGGGFALDGVKLFVEFGSVAELILTAARTEAGVALLLVPGGSGGVTHEPLPVIGPERQHATTFAGARVGAEAALGGPGDRTEALRDVLALGAALLAVSLAATGQRALDMTIDYVGMRVQFGRPIATFQSVQHHIANMATDAQAARLAAFEAVCGLDRAAGNPADVAYAKILASAAAREITIMAHQLHGGFGFMKEYDLQFYTRIAAGGALRFGTADDHLAAVERSIGL